MGKGGESTSAHKSKAVGKFTPEEVGRHRTPDDAWMVHKVGATPIDD